MSTLTTKDAGELAQRVEYFTPLVNLHQDADGYSLEVEMPGVNKQGVEITVEDGKLIIGGHLSPGGQFGQAVYRERRAGEYRRVFDLDPSIDGSKINASMEQGLLTVHLPKVEAVKPRKITVG
ncbi:MAG: Hsp20/alpha crystallin family protein [Terrimicrobiaceae bacterium]